MQAVITLFRDSKNFQPMARRRPVGMLPVLNRPILEWHIVNCVSSGIKRIRVIAVENPIAVLEFVGSGARWGASIEVLVYKDPCSLEELLTRIHGTVQSRLLVIPAETLTNLEYKSLVNASYSQGNVTRIVVDGLVEFHGRDHSRGYSKRRLETPIESGIFVVDSDDSNPAGAVDGLLDTNFISLETPKDLWAANMTALGGGFDDFLQSFKPGLSHQEPLLGHHTYIDSAAILRPPCLIGDYCRINPGASISEFSVIGDRVIVDQGATISSSLVCENTYVGSDTSIERCVVSGNFMINVDIGSWTSIDDPLLLSRVKRKIVYRFSEKMFDKILASFLLLITAPIWGIRGVTRIAQNKSFFAYRELMSRDIYFDPSSKDAARVSNFLWFDNSGPLVERLPGLVDVIFGKLRLVGVRPLKEDQFDRYEDDWAKQRFEALDGLFTPVDAECNGNVLEEEKIAAENYYTATRNIKEDLKILIKSVKNLLIGN
ncbi:MAG: sugar transferase [Desulfomonilaceae bacterium]